VERPFSPIGYFHNPPEGWYDGGEGNANDVFIFAWDTPRTADSITNGDGQMFVSQFPRTNEEGCLSFEPMGSTTDWHTTTAPVLTNQGRSMYWSVTKANVITYVGVEGLDRTKFSRVTTASVPDDVLDRGTRPFPPYQVARTSPTLSSDPAEPTVYGVGPSAQLWRMNYVFDPNDITVTLTTDLVSAKVLLSKDEAYVLYATQAYSQASGGLFMVQADGLQAMWNVDVLGGVQGDIAINAAGSVVYVANPSGERSNG
jgi:hypothetical protein